MADNTLTLEEREAKILSSFLLSRGSMQDIISLRNFTALFPKAQRSNPAIKELYRDLQIQRERQIDRVRRNIQLEVQLGRKVREDRAEAAAKERKKFHDRGDDGMEGMEGQFDVYGAGSKSSNKVSIEKANEQLEYATNVLQEEFNKLNEECDLMYEELNTIVGDLSDLRYGKFENEELAAEVVKSLEDLRKACDALPQNQTG